MLAPGWQATQPPKYRMQILISALLPGASQTWLQIPFTRVLFKTYRPLGLAQA